MTRSIARSPMFIIGMMMAVAGVTAMVTGGLTLDSENALSRFSMILLTLGAFADAFGIVLMFRAIQSGKRRR